MVFGDGPSDELSKKKTHILMNDFLVVYFFPCNCPFLQGAGGPRGPPGGRGPPGEGLPGPKVPAPNHSRTDNQHNGHCTFHAVFFLRETKGSLVRLALQERGGPETPDPR